MHYEHVISSRNLTICSRFSTLNHTETAKVVHFYENYMISHAHMTKIWQMLPSDVPKYCNISQNRSILSHLHYEHVIFCRIWTICSRFSTLNHTETAKLVHFYENYMISHAYMAEIGQMLPSDLPKHCNVSQNRPILTHLHYEHVISCRN